MRNSVVTIAFDATPVHAAAALTTVLNGTSESDEIGRARAEWLLAATLPLYTHLRNADPETYSGIDFIEFIRFENLASLTDDVIPIPDELHRALLDYFEILPGHLASRAGERSTAARDEHAAAVILIRRIFNVADFRIS